MAKRKPDVALLVLFILAGLYFADPILQSVAECSPTAAHIIGQIRCDVIKQFNQLTAQADEYAGD